VKSSALQVTKTPLCVRHAAVTAGHPLGAEVGARVLRRGGNAVDAAVATALAMAVVEPFMSCLAGGGSMLIHRPRRGESVALDFNVEAPAAAHARMYALGRGRGSDLFPWRAVVDDANVHGHRAVAVPGSLAGLSLALERYGTMELRDVVAPAARLARRGVPVDWYLALEFAAYAEELSRFPEAARTYLRRGRFPLRAPGLDAGDRLRQPQLARSLELIGKEGADAFYRGELAEAIEAEMKRGGGILTRADLAAYRVRVTPPLEGHYAGVALLGMPGATGCVTALEALNILAHRGVGRFGPDEGETYRTRAQAFGAAFADRFRYLGDPEHVGADWRRLASPAHAARVAARLDAGARRPGRTSRGPRGADECTTHVGVVDRDRTLVSLTHTAVSLFGSKVVVPGTGLLLSNGMMWFDPEPGRANSIGPRKRALVNMTPFLVLRDGAPYLTVGAPGGRKIVTAIPQVLSNLLDFRLTPQAAVEAPRLHTEGEAVYVDDRVGARTLAALRRLGRRVIPLRETFSTFYFARPQVIQVTSEGLVTGVDHLRPVTAMGF
jgi:gamma-glutamyltranspeptidase / glutathione hydrolase